MKKSKQVIHLIAAARPNFMKIAPLYHTLRKKNWAEPEIIHTGQHYDLNMSDDFFNDLNLPEPHIHLGIGSGTHAEQTGRVMIAYEKILLNKRPDLTIVVGDVNSTLAATLAATKLGVKVAHLEAGLRAYDRSMPEEINRVVTDSLADILWTPSPDADENLKKEGISSDKIQRVGNIMIDSIEMLRPCIEKEPEWQKLKLKRNSYGLVTLHRPSNVDLADKLKILCKALHQIAEKTPLVFPAHPRTMKNLKKFKLLNLIKSSPHILLISPLSYIPFMNLVFNCRFVITDSGGIQEETTYLGIPCLTVRPHTERPITITQGTNKLTKPKDLNKQVEAILNNKREKCKIKLWDGKTAKRIAETLSSTLYE